MGGVGVAVGAADFAPGVVLGELELEAGGVGDDVDAAEMVVVVEEGLAGGFLRGDFFDADAEVLGDDAVGADLVESRWGGSNLYLWGEGRLNLPDPSSQLGLGVLAQVFSFPAAIRRGHDARGETPIVRI